VLQEQDSGNELVRVRNHILMRIIGRFNGCILIIKTNQKSRKCGYTMNATTRNIEEISSVSIVNKKLQIRSNFGMLIVINL